MTQVSNQFSQTPVTGMLDLAFSPNTIPCVVLSTEATALIPGQCVKLVDNTSGIPTVTAIAADTDNVFGVVAYNQKDPSFAAGDVVEIACDMDVIYMTASAAIARGAAVMAVVTGSKVATATVGKTVIGFAFDKAAADGSVIRVYLKTFSNLSDSFVQAANVAAVVTADAADLATAIALANALKTTLNAEIAALKAAGLQASA